MVKSFNPSTFFLFVFCQRIQSTAITSHFSSASLSVKPSNQQSALVEAQPTASRCKRPTLLINVSERLVFTVGFIREGLTASRFFSTSSLHGHVASRKKPLNLLFTRVKRAGSASPAVPCRFQSSCKLKLCAGSLAALPSETRLATQGSKQRPRLLAIYPSFVPSSF